jgi:hypothetical protein
LYPIYFRNCTRKNQAVSLLVLNSGSHYFVVPDPIKPPKSNIYETNVPTTGAMQKNRPDFFISADDEAECFCTTIQ